MATKVKRVCPRCHQMVTGACVCARTEHGRPNAARRGYGTRWQRFREWFISRHPRCEDCWAEGVDNRAKLEVHHKVPLRRAPERQYEEANCMTLCEHHHSTRTARGE